MVAEIELYRVARPILVLAAEQLDESGDVRILEINPRDDQDPVHPPLYMPTMSLILSAPATPLLKR